MKKAAGKSTPKSKPAKAAVPKNRGLVIVITGDGKGKTTSAFGQALRAVGQGYRVYIMQFMKGRQYGESVAAQKYLPGLTVRHSGLDSFVMRDNPAPVDIELARKGFELAKKAIASGLYDMVILDEINVAVDFKLISLAELISVITSRPPGLDLILTGRYAAKEVIRLADTVSEIKDIKHHYAAGIKGRAGIEY
ncbi:MAG: cob(I)yrinic acid a,c-diamide adenosyltransferase [Smithella sp.]|jgi:cob(I)alamin adenosyltransferase|nr:cob(I)yrinic acid a,c-diamide adenosyltransferase [Smithella sp.]